MKFGVSQAFGGGHNSKIGKDGSAEPRIIYGVLYNAALKARRTVKCSRAAFESDDPDVFYMDHAVRFTENELRNLNLSGKPLCVQHQPDLKVGQILHNFVDKNGDLRIVAEIWNNSPLGKEVTRMVDAGDLKGLSIGYSNSINPQTMDVEHKLVKEGSLVIEPHFENCEVEVRASKATAYKQKTARRSYKTRTLNFTVTRSVNAAKKPMSNTQQQPTPMDEEKANNNSNDPQDDGEDLSNLSPEELLRQVAELKRRALENEKKAMEASERAKSLDEKNAYWEKQEEIRRQKYAEENASKAEEVLNYLKELGTNVNPDGGFTLSENFQEGMKQTLLAPEASEMATVQVTAARVYKKLKKEVTDLNKRNGELTKLLALGREAAVITDDDERNMRREVKAARQKQQSRNGISSVTQPSSTGKPAPPSWMQHLIPGGMPHMSSSGGVGSVSNPPSASSTPVQKPVNAGMSTPSDGSASNPIAPTPLRPGLPTNPESMRNDPRNREVWNWFKQMGDGDIGDNAMRHLAGRDMRHKFGR